MKTAAVQDAADYVINGTKCFASDAAMKIPTDAVQVLGGYGYTKDFPVERMFRDAKLRQIFEDTNQIQRLVIAREIFEEAGFTL